MNRRAILKHIPRVAAFWQAVVPSLLRPASVTKAAPNPSAAIAGAQPTTAPRLDSSSHAAPKFEDYASVEARVNGEPIYGLDYMMYIYGISPDLMPEIVMQEGNTHPQVKIKPKKSWEIKYNLLGSNTAQHPRSRQNDFQNFLPAHLIDGDPGTAWCSFGSIAPDVHPEWIRIDLPIESTVASVALVLSNTYYPGSNFGRSLPRELTVKLSTDAWHWETVYESKDVDINTPDRLEIKFAPRRAKQIWVNGNNFTKQGRIASSFRFLTFFSIGEVEVRDPGGRNLALASRGAGVTVSSTNFTHSDNRLTQDALWGPLHYDAGMKWLRSFAAVGVVAGPYHWLLIEKEKGRYEVDPVLDHWFTDVHRCGINLIMGLDISEGNPIYQNPPKEVNWLEARWKGLPSTGSLGWVDQTPEMLDAWLRFVEFFVRHFKDRAYIWEIGNEWTDPGWDYEIVERYMKIFEKAYEAVKRADPNARIMPGATAGFAPDLILTLLGAERKSGMRNGKLVANGGNLKALETSTLAIAENTRVRDTEVSVDAVNRGRFGIVLRYATPQSFLIGGCGIDMPGYGHHVIYIAERTGNAWEPSRITAKDINYYSLSLNLQLKMRVEGTQATLTISDGNLQETISHNIKDPQLNRAGSVGLIQLTGNDQAFQNFLVRDLEGREVLREVFQGEVEALPAGWRYVFGPQAQNPVKPGWASKIDGVAWHPSNSQDPAYFNTVREMQKQCRETGFKGRFYANELFFFFSYPPTPRFPMSELQQGTATMASVVGHSGLDTLAVTQILHYTGYSGTDSNCRLAWPTQVATPVQPSVMYYMWRTLATVLDDFHPVEFPVTFTEDKELLWFTFERGRNEKMVAVWITKHGATSPNEVAESRSDIALPGTRIKQAWVVDLMNGTEQELVIKRYGYDTHIDGIRVKSYPTIIRFSLDRPRE